MLIWKDFQDILNEYIKQSLGLVEGKLSGRSFHQVWLSTTIQGFLERKEQPPWEEVIWDDSLPAPYLLLTIGKKMRRVDNKRIAIGPLSGPEQFDPDMRVCDLLLS